MKVASIAAMTAVVLSLGAVPVHAEMDKEAVAGALLLLGAAAPSICPIDRNVPAAVASRLDATLRMVVDDQAETAAMLGYAPGAELFVRSPHWTYHRAAGTTDLATGAPLICGAPFQIGSNTKMMTAVVLMQLVEEGLLSLDDLLASHLPDIAAALPHGEEITIRQLANHTSGVFSYTDNAANGAPGIMEGALTDPGLLARDYEPRDLVQFAIDNGEPSFDPGAEGQWAYSNTGYVLIGMILEKTTGQPLEELFRDRIFDPLGMKDTVLWNAVPAPEFGLPRSYYQPPFDIETSGWNMAQGWAAGGVLSISADMDLFMRGLLSGSLYDDPATLTAMTDGGPAGAGFIRYGIGIGKKPGGFWGHGGQTLGFESDIGMFRDSDTSLVLWTNSASNLASLGSTLVLGALDEADALNAQDDGIGALAGTRWAWVSKLDGDGQTVTIGEPERYTISFQDGGDLALGADCNRFLGHYTVQDDTLSLELGRSTKALCPPDSLDDRFQHDLQAVTGFKRDGDTLVLVSETSGQSLQFALRGE
ncbi:serine hydrolase [Primorskyibacter sp. 2E233]|uniref:serine hydrolase n=1 Tax=Primorskyibacter sp. 2E233 TaxID=3413431 RepID=UPI003BF15DE8